MNSAAGALIFDLDGTLLDTLEDLADAGNEALTAGGFAPHPPLAYRFFVGDGMETLMRRAAPGASEAVLERLVAGMRAAYGLGWARKTMPYEGIEPLLEALNARALPLAVLSNKPDEFTRLMTRHFFPGVAFVRVQGSPKGGKAKPDPALALALARDLGVEPGRVLFLGDSGTDMDTAKAAGMAAVGALWGFRPESELRAHGAGALLEKPADLLGLL